MKTITWLVMLAVSYSATETLTFDSGAAGALPSGWAAADGGAAQDASAWRVLKERSAPTQPHVLAHLPAAPGHSPAPLAILDNPDFRNGEVSVKFKPLSGKPEQEAGIVWRYRDAHNYYLVRADAAAGSVAMYRVANGVRTPLVPRGRDAGSYAVKHRVRADDWNILKVTFRGSAFTVYYDHRRILQADDSMPGKPGKVGLWARPGSLAYFDNLRVVSRP